MVTTLILILGGVLLAALAVIYFSMVRRRQPRKWEEVVDPTRKDRHGRCDKTFSRDLSDTVFAVQCQICATDRSGRVDETLRFRSPFLAIAKMCEARIVRAPEALPFNWLSFTSSPSLIHRVAKDMECLWVERLASHFTLRDRNDWEVP
jgi:hypothetical protein